MRRSGLALTLATAMLAACGGQPPEPAAEEPASQPAEPAAPAAPATPAVTEVAFAAPVSGDKLEEWKTFVHAVQTERADEWDAARAAAGLKREVVWHQSTPRGDFAVVYQEADDVRHALKYAATSSAPIDEDFVVMLREVHGIDALEPPAPNELVAECHSDVEGGTPYALIAPIEEGNDDAANDLVKALGGTRHEEYQASCARRGLASERVWRQGPMFVVVWESAAPEQVMPAWAGSEDEFDSWYLDQVSAFMGRDAREPQPMNALMLDWSAPPGASAGSD